MIVREFRDNVLKELAKLDDDKDICMYSTDYGLYSEVKRFNASPDEDGSPCHFSIELGRCL